MPGFNWQNYEGTQSITPASKCAPQSLDDLVLIIKKAEASNQKVHAYGSAYSFSDCAMTTDVMVDTRYLNRPINTVQTAFNGTQPPYVFHVEAGITIHQLYTDLHSSTNPATRLAIETMGGASGQALAGAVSTGTHGGDLFMGAIADSVLAIHLVGAGGTQYWIEPTAAITNRAQLQAILPGVAPANIIYDDDWFNAVLVSVGCMGIIYAMVLRVRQQYNMIETTTATTWQDFKQNAAAYLSDHNYRFLQLAIDPYTDADGTNFTLMTRRSETTRDITNMARPGSTFHGVAEALGALLGELFLANPIQTVSDAANAVQTAINNGTLDGRAIVTLVNAILGDATDMGGDLRSVLTSHYRDILGAMLPPATIADLSYRIMDVTRFRPAFNTNVDQDPSFPDATGAWSLEVFLPAQPQAVGAAAPFVAFIDETIQLVNSANRTFLTGYIGVRFTGQTRAFLGMEQWNQTCAVEVAALPGVAGELELMTAILDQIYYYPVNQPLPLPHWGQFNAIDIHFYADRYPDYAKWQQVYSALSNNFTNRTFENALSDQWQLTWPPFYMKADVTLVTKSTEYTIQVVVTDKTTNLPVPEASVIIYDQGNVKKGGGATNTNGTVSITYSPCLDPDTKTPNECSGLITKEHYQDILFTTPL
jgi:hypothetical protein